MEREGERMTEIMGETEQGGILWKSRAPAEGAA